MCSKREVCQLTHRVCHRLAQQHAVRHVLEDGLGARYVLETDGVANLLTERKAAQNWSGYSPKAKENRSHSSLGLVGESKNVCNLMLVLVPVTRRTQQLGRPDVAHICVGRTRSVWVTGLTLNPSGGFGVSPYTKNINNGCGINAQDGASHVIKWSLYIYKYMQIYIYMCVCVCIYIYANICVYIYTYV